MVLKKIKLNPNAPIFFANSNTNAPNFQSLKPWNLRNVNVKWLMVLNCVFAFHLLSPWSLVIALESNVNCINLFLLAIIVSSKRCRYALPSSISYGSKRGFPLLSNSLAIQFGFLSSGYGLKGILIRSSIEVDLEQNYIVHTYKTADNGNRCRQDLLPNKCLLTP